MKILNEFIYFNSDESGMVEKDRYDPTRDSTVLHRDNLRKTRLTLRMINSLRKASDAKEQEKVKEIDLVKKMYATQKPEGPQMF